MLSIATIAAVSVLAGSASIAAPEVAQPAQENTMQAEPREKPLGRDEVMPAFTLMNADGEPVTLAEALESGPVVVTFYRGKWCPYCVKALESLDQSVSDINELGATVLAISPQTPENSIDLRKQTGLSYELLVDHDNQLATQLGLMFTLDERTQERYGKYGIDVPEANGTDEWQLPIPATYVIDTDRTVRYAWTNEDYSKRAPVRRILQTLRKIETEG